MSGIAPRGAVRSLAGWRAFDRASLFVSLLLALALLAWALRPVPSTEEPMADAAPVRLKLSDQRVTMQVLGSRLLLTGQAADEAERQAITAAAEQAFGAGGVDNRLVPTAGSEPLPWRDHAADIFKVLRATGGDAAITLTGRQVRLDGEVPADYARLAREVLARQWFGRSVVVDNQLRVAGAASASASASAPVATSTPTPAVVAAASVPARPAPAPAPAVAGPGAQGAQAALPAVCADLAQGVAVRFHPNAPGLTDEGRRSLRSLLPCLAQGRWQVGSHTDANGDPEANQRLTQARAESAAAYLAGKGVAASRLQAKGFAATRPVAGNDTPEDRLRNRRLSFEPLP